MSNTSWFDGEKEELKAAKAMSIEGPFSHERERLQGDFTDADRAYRRQYLKDQELAHDEPRPVAELERELRNPIRRFYRMPMDMFQGLIKPLVGEHWAGILRYHIPKHLMALGFVYATWYYFKYNGNDWTKRGGWKVRTTRRIVLPGDPDFPKLSDRSEPQDYYDRGFKSRKVFVE